ncbi:MAG TPA: TIGR04190 family B12-binding domain/radical SAM domain protein [Elusimicrobiota bacterium]|nr:TIGR04190 family B12-binding domain/radical SAM domain protein [Elusimicrobiota bacterium]
MRYDLALLHPPSVYDFRKMKQFRGPMSDVIPSSSIFDMYPVGFTSIAGFLERSALRVKIVNVAARMLRDAKFDAEKKIRGLDARAFGVGLHWLPHAQGALEIAKLVKKHHPAAPVIFGGLSATYYHRELAAYPFIDFVVRGDSTEEPMLRLMEELCSGRKNFSAVPSLTWKRGGDIVENAMGEAPANLNGINIPDYRYAVRSVIRDKNLLDAMPYHGWLDYPVTALLTVRGCTQNCSLCGGSRSAYKLNCGRQKPAMRSPEKLVQDIAFIQRFSRTPVFVIGDIRQGGEAYVEEFLTRVAALKPKNELVFELFWKAGDEFFSKIQRRVPRYSLEITLESADEDIRRANGKFACSNEEFIRLARSALAHGCRKLDVFFMVGLPRQTRESALRNVAFCEEIHRACGLDRRLNYFIAPLAPFLDPASRAFEHPEQFGYKRLAASLEDHIRHFMAPSWEFILNYETDAMNRRQIVEAMYESFEKLNDFKLECGLIDAETHQKLLGESRASLDHLARVREAVNSGADLELLPGFSDADLETTRTHKELRWRIRRRYAGVFSLACLGLEVFLEQWQARTHARS